MWASWWLKRGVDHRATQHELTEAPGLLARVPLVGRVVTGDALYCQRHLCQQIMAAGGDYLFTVKGNQPALHAAIALLFAEPPPGELFATAVTVNRHGDRREKRQLWTSTLLNEYVEWPGVRQVCKRESVVERKGKVTRAVWYAVTSLDLTAADVLMRWRGHWGIETRLHWVRDETLGEDRSMVRTGNAPRVWAGLRNAVIGVVRGAGWTNMAAALRHYAWQPDDALALLGITPSQ